MIFVRLDSSGGVGPNLGKRARVLSYEIVQKNHRTHGTFGADSARWPCFLVDGRLPLLQLAAIQLGEHLIDLRIPLAEEAAVGLHLRL